MRNEWQGGVINDKHIIFVTCNGSIKLVSYTGESDITFKLFGYFL